mmetsp:Transcript_53887/g.126365  ORF Transcript_53887/g.126365 Transcript_53887/m.126365 type:complete len:218 (+) Transcript_53887:141-794(+)
MLPVMVLPDCLRDEAGSLTKDHGIVIASFPAEPGNLSCLCAGQFFHEVLHELVRCQSSCFRLGCQFLVCGLLVARDVDDARRYGCRLWTAFKAFRSRALFLDLGLGDLLLLLLGRRPEQIVKSCGEPPGFPFILRVPCMVAASIARICHRTACDPNALLLIPLRLLHNEMPASSNPTSAWIVGFQAFRLSLRLHGLRPHRVQRKAIRRAGCHLLLLL